MFLVKQYGDGQFGRFADFDIRDVSNFRSIGDRANGAFRRFQYFEPNGRVVGQQCTAPTPRAERADRRQGQYTGSQRDDGAVRGEVIGRTAGWCRDKDAIADHFGHPLNTVDQNANLRCLPGLAQQRNLIDRERFAAFTVDAVRAQPQGDELHRFRLRYPFIQIVFSVLVHEEADGSPVHAENWPVFAHRFMQAMQDKSIATQRHDNIRILHRYVRIPFGEHFQSFDRLWRPRPDEC